MECLALFIWVGPPNQGQGLPRRRWGESTGETSEQSRKRGLQYFYPTDLSWGRQTSWPLKLTVGQPSRRKKSNQYEVRAANVALGVWASHLVATCLPPHPSQCPGQPYAPVFNAVKSIVLPVAAGKQDSNHQISA